jgi:hypothetical protein
MITREFWANNADWFGSSETERKGKLLNSNIAPLKQPHFLELQKARILRKITFFRS